MCQITCGGVRLGNPAACHLCFYGSARIGPAGASRYGAATMASGLARYAPVPLLLRRYVCTGAETQIFGLLHGAAIQLTSIGNV